MKPVTIDQLDLKDHVRWARDREILDTTIIQESQSIAPYPDVLGTSIIFSSHLEALFDWEKGMHPWANFVPPANLFLFNKRFFSHRLFPHIQTGDYEESEKDMADQEKEEQEKAKNIIEQVAAVQKRAGQPVALFERDKNSILALLESIRTIDDMLAQISGRKLQYQKG